jgi:LPXTG-motif cell wall-anchored protein
VSSSGSAGNSGASGTLGISQSSAKDSQAKDASNDDGNAVSALGDADVPLGTTAALDEAKDNSQQGGASPWVTAVLIGLTIVALAAALWFILRRRRRRREEAFAEA